MAPCPKCFRESDGNHCPFCGVAMEAGAPAADGAPDAFSRDDLAKTVVGDAPDFEELARLHGAAGEPVSRDNTPGGGPTQQEEAPPLADTLPRPVTAAGAARKRSSPPASVSASSSLKLASPASLPQGASLGDTKPDPALAVRFGSASQTKAKAPTEPAPAGRAEATQAKDLPPTVLAPVDSAAHKEIPPTVLGSTPTSPEVPPTVTADVAEVAAGGPEVQPTSPPPEALPEPAPPGPDVDTSAATLPTGATTAFREPGRGLMRLLMALGGLALLGLFLAPWDGERFFWQQRLTGMNFVFRLFLAAGGVVFLAGAAIPIPYGLRALVAFLVGLTPVVLAKVIELQSGSLGPEQVLGLLLLTILMLLPAALFHRGRVGNTVLGRVFVVMGVVGVLAFLMVPRGAGMPMVLTFRALSNVSTAAQAVGAALPLVLLLFGVLSMLAFMPARSTGLAAVWALGLLFYVTLEALHVPVLTLVNRGMAGEPLADILKTVGTGLCTGLYLTICFFMASYGLSQVFTRLAGGGDPPG